MRPRVDLIGHSLPNASQRWNPSRISILLAFVLFRRYHAILDPVGVKHRRGEIEEEQTEAPPGRGKRSKENKNTHRDCANHPEKAREDVSFIDVSQTGNDTEHHCDQIARFAFRGLCCAAHPITPVAAFRVFRQKMPAIRARHFIACSWFRLDGWRICVLHLHTYRKSQAAPNSSSKQNSEQLSEIGSTLETTDLWGVCVSPECFRNSQNGAGERRPTSTVSPKMSLLRERIKRPAIRVESGGSVGAVSFRSTRKQVGAIDLAPGRSR